MYTQPYEIILLVITILTMTVQFYSILLIHFKSPKTMKEYKFFLNLFSTWDAVFTISIGLFIAPYPVTPLMGSAARGIASYFGTEGAMITASVAIGLGGCVLGVQDYCLLYRFTVIYPNRIFHNFLMHKYIKILGLTLVHTFAISVGIGFYHMLIPAKDIPDFMAKQPPNYTETLIPGEPIIMVDVHNWYTKACIIFTVIAFCLSEIFCICTGFIILYILKKNAANFSRVTFRLHKQFTMLLAAQFISPLFFIVVPTTTYLIVVIIMENSSKRPLTMLTFALLTVYGASNAIFTIIFVSPYRKYTNEKLVKPAWNVLARFLRKYSLLPKQSGVGELYSNSIHPQISSTISGLTVASRT